LNGTQQILPYAADVNLLGDDTETIKKNTETRIHAGKEVGLHVNVEKTKYMLVPSQQHARQNQDIQKANRTFEYVSPFKYLETTVTSQNLIQDEIEKRPNCGNACYYSVHNILSSSLIRATRRNIPEDGIFRSHRRENLKYYMD
jgi:hypothetical protein